MNTNHLNQQRLLNLEKARSTPKRNPITNLIIRYGLDTKSRKEAIHMMCFSCQGGDAQNMPDPGWQRHIRDCTIKNCPLYNFRPYQNVK
jgi:hypothetical protein